MPNRLMHSLSPYLRQHADNPVGWWEWSDDALAEAERRDVPIFLSVGYAACHWCHVMAHESFEDAEVAATLNAAYVPIKVDREERPDIDAVYMAATTAVTGQGGWPMTCLLTPSGEPFFCGTYLPKAQLLNLLTQATRVWRLQRAEVQRSSASIAEGLRDLARPASPVSLGKAQLGAAVARLTASYDDHNGGFGAAPKFPPSMVLEFLTRHHGRTGSNEALRMLDGTLDAMARGGIYDQLAGGFARYSVDAGWVVPHFEKMLYDNAQLSRVYAHQCRVSEGSFGRRIACETADFILRDLGTTDGAFASSLDADTRVEGRSAEGFTYVWTPEQLIDELGAADGERAADLLSVTDAGTFDGGASVLQLHTDPDDPQWWSRIRRRLLAARARRPQPARDDKVVTSWNGLAIAALSDIGALFGRPDLVDAATTCAALLLERHMVDGRLRRASLGARVSDAPGVLDDHGNLAEGLLALHQATGDARWLEAAGRILDSAEAHFLDGDTWHDTADDAGRLIVRPRTGGDNAEPSGLSAIAMALVGYAALTGSEHHRDLAEDAIATGGVAAARDPRFAGWALAGAEAVASGPVQVAIVGTGPLAANMIAIARRAPSPGLVIAHGRPDAPNQPLLVGRPLVDGKPAAYVCHGFVCSAPVSSSAALRIALGV